MPVSLHLAWLQIAHRDSVAACRDHNTRESTGKLRAGAIQEVVRTCASKGEATSIIRQVEDTASELRRRIWQATTTSRVPACGSSLVVRTLKR